MPPQSLDPVTGPSAHPPSPSDETLYAAARDGWGVMLRLQLLLLTRGVASRPAATILAIGAAAGTPALAGAVALLTQSP